MIVETRFSVYLNDVEAGLATQAAWTKRINKSAAVMSDRLIMMFDDEIRKCTTGVFYCAMTLIAGCWPDQR